MVSLIITFLVCGEMQADIKQIGFCHGPLEFKAEAVWHFYYSYIGTTVPNVFLACWTKSSWVRWGVVLCLSVQVLVIPVIVIQARLNSRATGPAGYLFWVCRKYTISALFDTVQIDIKRRDED